MSYCNYLRKESTNKTISSSVRVHNLVVCQLSRRILVHSVPIVANKGRLWSSSKNDNPLSSFILFREGSHFPGNIMHISGLNKTSTAKPKRVRTESNISVSLLYSNKQNICFQCPQKNKYNIHFRFFFTFWVVLLDSKSLPYDFLMID